MTKKPKKRHLPQIQVWWIHGEILLVLVLSTVSQGHISLHSVIDVLTKLH
jgi:hypothetical protein